MDGASRALRELEAFRAEVDAAARGIAGRLGARIRCRRGCTDCCVDGLTVLTVEAEAIRRAAPELLASGLPHPPGRCAFLDPAGACRVYPVRPYVCRTQGLPLAWIEETTRGRPVEMRDICPLNDPGGPPLETLPDGAVWHIGPWEGRLAAIQRTFAGRLERVALRDLFGPGTPVPLPVAD